MLVANKSLSKVACAVIALAGLCSVFSANADTVTDYPVRPITIMTPTAAGGGTDIVARIVSDKLAALLGQPIVINNKPGAGGVIGNQAMLREKNDGYSLFVTANSNQLITPWVFRNANFDPLKDFEPVTGLGTVPYVLAVHPDFPAKNLDEFLTLIKENPGQFQYASAGPGTLNHLIPEMLTHAIGTEMEHIPYRGVAPAMADVLGGRVPVVFGSLSSVLENIRSGKLRALGVSSATRTDVLPDTPAIIEKVPGFQSEMWVALYAPAGTPKSIIDKLHSSAQRALDDPGTQKLFKGLGMSVMKKGPAELAKLQEAEYQQWKETVARAGVRAE
ncbi:LacI family transcriptional regulator [Advenella sp. S44]|uniref:Bug family tripartite tricarboxylate transporter substrate binding protein n=1 Tax=Advenella sp. S44 TaxID=1982755 RepID=UPI000C2AD5D2|nr:tripartite tricarboxylate transporter substrate binding protein [Advenella sp. S44]PJX28079.1 LacI family transcriptional regulator [Advenella sp. S44]